MHKAVNAVEVRLWGRRIPADRRQPRVAADAIIPEIVSTVGDALINH